MMAVTETSVTAGLLTIFYYGLAPLALFLWLAGTPARRRRRSVEMADEEMRQKDAADPGRNE
jgi:hypothetical protein